MKQQLQEDEDSGRQRFLSLDSEGQRQRSLNRSLTRRLTRLSTCLQLIFLPFTYVCALFSIPVHVSSHRYYKPHNHSQHHRNLSSLIYPTRSTHIQHLVAGGLWNCQSATRKTEFISGFATEQCLDFLALTETWITPSNTATPAALSSAHSFSHTPRFTGRGGGTGLLINPNCDFHSLPTATLLFTVVHRISCCNCNSPSQTNHCCHLPSTRPIGTLLEGTRCPPLKHPRKWPTTCSSW